MVPVFYFNESSLFERYKSSSSICTIDARRNMQRYTLTSGRGLTRETYLIIADWHDIEINVASEARIERLKSKEVGMTKIAGCLRRWFSQGNKVTHNVKLFAIRESRDSTRWEYPLFWARRGVSFCRAQAKIRRSCIRF